jgi:hypothetical protein
MIIVQRMMFVLNITVVSFWIESVHRFINVFTLNSPIHSNMILPTFE